MKRFIFVFSVFCTGLLVSSCIDKHEEVDEDSRPEWLRGSIYSELKNPQSNLEGSFTTYLQLVDDLGYGETLSRTGSKTVFPANDDAFKRFFESGIWPDVHGYGDLSLAQKKLLLYSSMLDNAMLVGMMSNVESSGGILRGQAMKHPTSLSNIDTITHLSKPSEYYLNNPYFKRFDENPKGIYFVGDKTVPMMVHFTREYMLNHSLSTVGEGSDFSVLTGHTYDEKENTGYVFRNKIIHKDVVCQNGYIHQMDEVIVPPGNMAQVLKQEGGDTKLFSRMLDRFAMPLYNSALTREYRASADQYGWEPIDSIFEVRYMSTSSYDDAVNNDPDKIPVNQNFKLPFDPGWNGYYMKTGQTGSNSELSEIAAILAPEDKAVEKYFLPGGIGEFLIDRYGKKPNTKENLAENIDSIPQDKIQVIMKNLMKPQMTKTVPSLFAAVTDNASDLMGLKLSHLRRNANDQYDVRIANNGVVYVLNTLMSPPDFSAVSAPALVRETMRIINWLIQNKSAESYSVAANGSVTVNKYKYSIDLDYYTYLLAMTANYAQFLPTDEAFSKFYVNAASLSTDNPTAFRFFFDTERFKNTSGLGISSWRYNPTTKAVTDSIGEVDLDEVVVVDGTSVRQNYNIVKSMLVELMNMHTIVLKKGEQLGDRNYYLTKLGAGVRVENVGVGGTIATSAQMNGGWPKATISQVYHQTNGTAYQLDNLLQPPTQSVYQVLKKNSQFSEFLGLCQFFNNATFMKWLGVDIEMDPETGAREADQYVVFEQPKAYNYQFNATDEKANETRQLATYKDDYVVKFFSTYNYTVFAPNNSAMEIAYSKGLPRYTDVLSDYQKSESGQSTEDYETIRQRLLKDVKILRQFVRYHFMNNTVFADKTGDSNVNYPTFMPNADGVNERLGISVSGNKLFVSDAAAAGDGARQKPIEINAAASGKVVNEMTRDVILDARYDVATTVYTSSFAVVHELDEPLCMFKDGSFNVLVADARKMR